MAKQVQLTQEGFVVLKRELEDLVSSKRPKLVERLAYARAQGDLMENSDYTNAREELEFLDGRIDELSEVLKNATVVRCKPTGGINVGTKVTVKANGSTHVFEIVGEWEANPAKRKISPDSPLGRALSGKKVGSKVEVEAPAGKVTYEILAIN